MLYVADSHAVRAASQHGAINTKQFMFMIHMHNSLSAILKHTNSTLEEYSHFIRFAFAMLLNIVTALEMPGIGREGMTEEYTRQLFGLGEQVLTALESAISRWHSNLKLDFETLPAQYSRHKILTTQKQQRHLRRDTIHHSIYVIQYAAIDDAKRIGEASDVALLCGGLRMTISGHIGGQWELPALKGKQEPRWDAEMHYYAMRALKGAAQCLGHRFMRWPVTIEGQVVPGTGVVKGETLEDWRVVQFEERERQDSGTFECFPS